MDINFKKLQKELDLSKKDFRQTGQNKVKDKRAAPIQITAEQILRVSHQHQERYLYKDQAQITDKEELYEYLMLKRTEFEREVAKNRHNPSWWLKYAAWEEKQHYFERARNIYERALEVDYRNASMWIRYAEMEVRNKFVNHARNIYDRATTLLPRINNLWLKYTYLEEMMGDQEKCREVYERWIKWLPDANAFKAYIKFEVRNKEVPKARIILEKMIRLYPSPQAWLYYAKFERKNGKVSTTRKIYERAVANIGNNNEKLFLSFAQFEEENQEYDRARVIYKFAIDNVPKKNVQRLYKSYLLFEKKFGEREEISKAIVSKKRFHYEEILKENPLSYDTWFDYIQLEEKEKNTEKIIEVYERAISQLPPVEEKQFWKRYVYFWIKYAFYEELTNQNFEKTREIYEKALSLIPHKKFSFSKIWIHFAKFEIRRKNIEKARKIFGQAIGKCPKEKVFQEYIKMELLLGNVKRVRTIHEKLLEYDGSNPDFWIQYAQFEQKLGKFDRARNIFEIGIQQEPLDMPEKLWKGYIDFEIALKNSENVRKLYERLLKKTKHVKVWISYAEYEVSIKEIKKAREVFRKANDTMKDGVYASEEEEIEMKEQRVVLLNKWKQFEETFGDEENLNIVLLKMPRRVKRKRKITTQEGNEIGGFEEYFDYIFEKEESTPFETSKLLDIASKWKQNKNKE